MKLGFNVFGEVGVYELRVLFYVSSENGFSTPTCKHEEVDIVCGQEFFVAMW